MEMTHGYPVEVLTHCYLSSQIKGKIYDPAYYFNEENTDRLAAIDLLLLTQGWRRYIWQQDNLTPYGQFAIADEITGIQTIKDKKFKNPEQFIQVSNLDGNSQLTATDSTGHFSISVEDMKVFRGEYIYLKPLLLEDYKPKLNIDEPFTAINQIRQKKKIYYPLSNPNASIEKEEHPDIFYPNIIKLNEVIITGKTKKPFRDKYMGRLDSLAKINLGPWVCEDGYLDNYRPGYTHHHNPLYCPCPHEAKQRNIPVEGEVYILWKVKFTYDCWFIVEDYKKIVYHGPLYTDEELLQMNNLWRVKGYYGAREFFKPDEEERHSPLPDVRNTLFWSPSVITGS
jgi:hypothetical protein